jgi:hypothetical protein
MRWVCISRSSNTKNIDQELYVVNDRFTKGSRSCSTLEDWCNGFSFLAEKLSPHLKKIAFYPVEIGFKAEAGLSFISISICS